MIFSFADFAEQSFATEQSNLAVKFVWMLATLQNYYILILVIAGYL